MYLPCGVQVRYIQMIYAVQKKVSRKENEEAKTLCVVFEKRLQVSAQIIKVVLLTQSAVGLILVIGTVAGVRGFIDYIPDVLLPQFGGISHDAICERCRKCIGF